MVAVPGELRGEAAEADRAEAFADREVVLLAPAVPVEHDHGAADLAPRRRLAQGAADLASADRMATSRLGFDQQAGTVSGADVGGDSQPERGGIGKALAVIILQAPAGRRNQVGGAGPAQHGEGREEQQGEGEGRAPDEGKEGGGTACGGHVPRIQPPRVKGV